MLAVAGPEPLRRPARTWALALLGVFFYKPLSPWPHAYLDQPIALIRAINLALLVAWLLTTHRLAAWARLATAGRDACVLRAGRAQVSAPPPRSLRGARDRSFGARIRSQKPPGCGNQFGRLIGPGEWYRWEDYRPLLAYIRASTPPETRIANLLWNVPYPPRQWPRRPAHPLPRRGRLHPPLDGRSQLGRGLCRDPGAEHRHPRGLGAGKANPFFPELDRTVHEWYRPVARFGAIEVWRHRCARRGRRRQPQLEAAARGRASGSDWPRSLRRARASAARAEGVEQRLHLPLQLRRSARPPRAAAWPPP